jgi:DNA-binding MarR family transcriptional regulator
MQARVCRRGVRYGSRPSSTVPDDATIRQLLNRRDLAAARHRAAVSRQLGLGESEMLAVAYLAQRAELTPGELGALLDLSSGGVSALVQRLEEAGHVLRTAHPTDGRSSLVRLSPALVARAGRAFGPLVADLDGLSADLDDEQRQLVRRFLTRVAEVSEAHAERAYREQHGTSAPAAATQVPSLWG